MTGLVIFQWNLVNMGDDVWNACVAILVDLTANCFYKAGCATTVRGYTTGASLALNCTGKCTMKYQPTIAEVTSQMKPETTDEESQTILGLQREAVAMLDYRQ